MTLAHTRPAPAKLVVTPDRPCLADSIEPDALCECGLLLVLVLGEYIHLAACLECFDPWTGKWRYPGELCTTPEVHGRGCPGVGPATCEHPGCIRSATFSAVSAHGTDVRCCGCCEPDEPLGDC